MKNWICKLFRHPISTTGTEDGRGREFRYVSKCTCGERVETSEWTDDNQLLGYRKD